MLVVEPIAKIRPAYVQDKKPIKQICRVLRMSRNTVRRMRLEPTDRAAPPTSCAGWQGRHLGFALTPVTVIINIMLNKVVDFPLANDAGTLHRPSRDCRHAGFRKHRRSYLRRFVFPLGRGL